MNNSDDIPLRETRPEDSEPNDDSIIRETIPEVCPEEVSVPEGTFSEPIEDGPSQGTAVSGPTKGNTNEYGLSDREPVCVIIEPSSTSLNDTSSTELLIDTRTERIYPKFRRKNNYIRIVLPDNLEDVTTISKIHRNDLISPDPPLPSESNDEVEMININLQSENSINIDDNDVEKESVVMAYLRNQDLRIEGSLASKKKTSLVKGVPKMETIPESDVSSLPSAEVSNAEGSKPESGDREDAQDKPTDLH